VNNLSNSKLESSKKKLKSDKKKDDLYFVHIQKKVIEFTQWFYVVYSMVLLNGFSSGYILKRKI
jgi:hypothetical protein